VLSAAGGAVGGATGKVGVAGAVLVVKEGS
jgi:hypothetical protein